MDGGRGEPGRDEFVGEALQIAAGDLIERAITEPPEHAKAQRVAVRAESAWLVAVAAAVRHDATLGVREPLFGDFADGRAPLDA